MVASTRMKVVNLKQAILQAWKERWSDYQWAINIKKNFPKGATCDYPNLAGCCCFIDSILILVCLNFEFVYLSISVYPRGLDGAGDDWTLSQPLDLILSKICNKLSGEGRKMV